MSNKKGPVFSPLSITAEQQAEFEALVDSFHRPAGFRWLDPSNIPSAVPESLRAKFVSGLLIWEQNSSGCTYIVCNGVRLDGRANALDQEPFALAVRPSGASTAVMFCHHGDWTNRTIEIAQETRAVLESTSLGNYFPLGEVPAMSSGPLSALAGTSHEGAFKRSLWGLRRGST
jgi:hypothetical protein